MCYINGIKVSLATYMEYKKIQKELKHINSIVRNKQVLKGFDYSNCPVIKTIEDGTDWNVVPMEWGFLPPGLKNREAVNRFRNGYTDESGKFINGFTTLNAMGEELLLPGKIYREAALHRRCLILSSGFYEHRHIFEKHKKTGELRKTPTKFPYHIIVPSKEIFLIAGVYNTWIDEDTGEKIDTVAAVTTTANKIMQRVHNSKMRMPVILTDELAERWTDPDLTEAEIASIATYQLPWQMMAAYPVRKDFLKGENPAEIYIEPHVPDLRTYNYGQAV